MPYLFPELLAIVRRRGEYEADVRRQALSILHSMIGMLATMAGIHDAQIKVRCSTASVLHAPLGWAGCRGTPPLSRDSPPGAAPGQCF